MILPTLDKERLLWGQGIDRVVGIDEAGRGAWAGPVVVGAVVLPKNLEVQGEWQEIRDSKLMSPKKREKLFDFVTKNTIYSVGFIDNAKIDEVNILQATFLAVQKSISELGVEPQYALLDALEGVSLPCRFESITKGDQKVLSIAAASIVAKVTRDRMLFDFDKIHPGYGFATHKGYGTKDHKDSLEKHGVCDIHRLSYNPVKQVYKKNTAQITD